MSKKPTTIMVPTRDAEQSTALVPASPSAYDEDTILPRYKIVQPVSKEGTPGTLRSNVTGEEVSSLDITPVLYRKGRVAFEEGADAPVCRSNDSLYPDVGVPEPVSQQCGSQVNGRFVAACEWAEWGANREKPKCMLTYNLICASDDAGPFMISFHGSSIKPVRKLITFSRFQGLPLPSPYALCNIRCTLSLDEVKGGFGKYYVARFEGYKRLDAQEVEQACATLLQQFAAYDVGAHFAAEAAGDAIGEDATF